MQTIRIIHDERNGEHTYSSPDLPTLLIKGESLLLAKEELHATVDRLLQSHGITDSYRFKLVER